MEHLDIPSNPFLGEAPGEVLQGEPTVVFIPETTEEFVSARVRPPAPDPALPSEVAQALGITPSRDTVAAAPSGDESSSIFWDDENYFVEILWQGDTGIRLRELSEETQEWYMDMAQRGEVETDGRVSAQLIGLMLGGMDALQKATEVQKKALNVISKEDGKALKSIIQESMDKALCEGIAGWQSRSDQTLPECTDERKLKMGKPLRQKCLLRIMELSTGFGEIEQDFLAQS